MLKTEVIEMKRISLLLLLVVLASGIWLNLSYKLGFTIPLVVLTLKLFLWMRLLLVVMI